MTDRCPSCNVLWSQHPGIAPTCAELHKLRAALQRIADLNEGDCAKYVAKCDAIAEAKADEIRKLAREDAREQTNRAQGMKVAGEDVCPVCKTPFTKHTGIVGTCLELSNAKRHIEQIRTALDAWRAAPSIELLTRLVEEIYQSR